MKKLMLGLAALVTLVSGVAMVSAYESHVVNVTAHVENALNVEPKIIGFGDVEPQQWLIEEFSVGISSSFSTQTRVSKIDYSICAEWKVDEDRNFAWWDGTQWVVVDTGFYNWMGYFTYVGIDTGPDPLADVMTLVGDPPEELGVPAPPGTKAKCVLASTTPLHNPVNLSDNVTIGVDVPVYEGASIQIPMPSGLDEPSWIIPAAHPTYDEEYMEFGIDLIIQVTNVYN